MTIPCPLPNLNWNARLTYSSHFQCNFHLLGCLTVQKRQLKTPLPSCDTQESSVIRVQAWHTTHTHERKPKLHDFVRTFARTLPSRWQLVGSAFKEDISCSCPDLRTYIFKSDEIKYTELIEHTQLAREVMFLFYSRRFANAGQRATRLPKFRCKRVVN